MSEILYGGPVAERLRGELRGRIDALLARGVRPCLAIVRVGEAPVSLSYERAALREEMRTARLTALPPNDAPGAAFEAVARHDAEDDAAVLDFINSLA